jgi:hypothetical protein
MRRSVPPRRELQCDVDKEQTESCRASKYLSEVSACGIEIAESSFSARPIRREWNCRDVN